MNSHIFYSPNRLWRKQQQMNIFDFCFIKQPACMLMLPTLNEIFQIKEVFVWGEERDFIMFSRFSNRFDTRKN